MFLAESMCGLWHNILLVNHFRGYVVTFDSFNAIVQAFPLFGQQFRRDDFRQVLFPGESTSLWTISPPARELLKDQLLEITQSPNSSIRLQFAWSITRLVMYNVKHCGLLFL